MRFIRLMSLTKVKVQPFTAVNRGWKTVENGLPLTHQSWFSKKTKIQPLRRIMKPALYLWIASNTGSVLWILFDSYSTTHTVDSYSIQHSAARVIPYNLKAMNNDVWRTLWSEMPWDAMSDEQIRTYDTIFVVEIEFRLSFFLLVNTWPMFYQIFSTSFNQLQSATIDFDDRYS